MSDESGILLFTVTDVFWIEGRGCVILPGLPSPSPTIPVLKRNSPITLRHPDGAEIRTFIRELEMINRRSPVTFLPFLLPSTITKTDVPIGTKVWYFPTPEDTFIPARTS